MLYRIGYKRHAVIHGYDCNRAYKLQQLENILEERQKVIIDQQIEIEMWISGIKKSDIRQIFEHRYIDKMKWFEIAQLMEFDNEDVPRKRHDRYLEKKM